MFHCSSSTVQNPFSIFRLSSLKLAFSRYIFARIAYFVKYLAINSTQDFIGQTATFCSIIYKYWANVGNMNLNKYCCYGRYWQNLFQQEIIHSEVNNPVVERYRFVIFNHKGSFRVILKIPMKVKENYPQCWQF